MDLWEDLTRGEPRTANRMGDTIEEEQWTTGIFGCFAWRPAWEYNCHFGFWGQGMTCPCLLYGDIKKDMMENDMAQRLYAMDGPCCKCPLQVHSLVHSVSRARVHDLLRGFQQAMCLFCFPFISGENRSRIRRQKQIPGSLARDILLHACCFPCALAQEARQLKDDPFQSTDHTPFPTWRRIFKPCFPMSKRDERLLTAAEEGRVEDCIRWVTSGANVNATDKLKMTPLMKASATGQLKTCEYLLQAKANTNMRDRSGATALFKAAQRGNHDVIKLLWKAGAKIDIKDTYRKTVMDYSTDETKQLLRHCYGIVEERKLTSEEAAAKILEIGYAAL
uniref:Uncharacterized protein n=1 Tax=Guillardia theta TaxID=55529 RepID=A0A7S4P630_GUITH|mmetsp:Transcript_44056/g.139017  ORF Transcript_44056/g.139017 Transcript_44056/m.139017 type:complete len:335 (+) Transcript_44056:204-1208(+)